MKYEIVISEEQRAFIERALRAYSVNPPEDLVEMFAALPADEAEAPGASHDFTL